MLLDKLDKYEENMESNHPQRSPSIESIESLDSLDIQDDAPEEESPLPIMDTEAIIKAEKDAMDNALKGTWFEKVEEEQAAEKES
jgi:hypothetical protein